MALFWFTRAAGQEDALALAKLGLMYSQGRGALQDFIQAHTCILSSCPTPSHLRDVPPRIAFRRRISYWNGVCGLKRGQLEVSVF